MPFVARTSAPRGQTPVLRAPLTRDHLSAISARTPDGRLLAHVQEEAFRGPAIVAFLRQLRQVRGKLLVIWDGAPIHRCQPVKDFLAAGAARRLHLERLPGYAPELNAAEGVWNLLKRRELANRCCHDLDEPRWELGLAIRRLQRRPTYCAPASASAATFSNPCSGQYLYLQHKITPGTAASFRPPLAVGGYRRWAAYGS